MSKNMSLQTVRGTHDLLPDECERHNYIVRKAEALASRYGFRPMSTPIFESMDVFKRTLGDTSDIVNKEMYCFKDRGDDWLTLRPEGTAGIARAFISEGLSQLAPLKFFYNGPMFRYERPQKGRQRQFHQLGVELIGVASPIADIECIALANLLLNELGIKDKVRLEINTIGDSESRKAYSSKLVEYLTQHTKDLSEDSQRRLTQNPLRILDSKDAKDLKITAHAPKLAESLNSESKQFFDTICNSLTNLNIAYAINPHLVRGLDYYCHCVFEFRTDALGAQDAVISGGRYDNLIKLMGGPSTPGVGWAGGIERLSMLAPALAPRTRPAAVVALGEKSEQMAMKLTEDLRAKGYYVELTYSGNMSKRMKKASGLNARWAIIIGDDEVANQTATLKDLDSGEQKNIAISQLAFELGAPAGPPGN